jgi:hypothetical protein
LVYLNYKKGCIRIAAASDKVYQLLAHGRWFSPGTPASSTTKTGRHDIAESGVKYNKPNQTNLVSVYCRGVIKVLVLVNMIELCHNRKCYKKKKKHVSNCCKIHKPLCKIMCE